MTNNDPRNSHPDAGKTGRGDRLAAALRENLKKRKELARKRTQPDEASRHADDTPDRDCDDNSEPS